MHQREVLEERQGTDGEFPGVGEFPEDERIEEMSYGLVLRGISEGFGPGVQDILEGKQLILDVFDGKS